MQELTFCSHELQVCLCLAGGKFISSVLSFTLLMELQMFLLWRSTSNILLNYSHVALWQYVPEAQCTWYAVEFHFLSFNLLFFNFSSFSIWKGGKWDLFFLFRHHCFTCFFFPFSSLLSCLCLKQYHDFPTATCLMCNC